VLGTICLEALYVANANPSQLFVSVLAQDGSTARTPKSQVPELGIVTHSSALSYQSCTVDELFSGLPFPLSVILAEAVVMN